MNKLPPKETWCKSCDGEGRVFVLPGGFYRRCESCDGSGETVESLNWRPEESDDGR